MSGWVEEAELHAKQLLFDLIRTSCECDMRGRLKGQALLCSSVELIALNHLPASHPAANSLH